ncbi:MAG: T9SS type A sorting domain-containing protein [Candidatus Marinimicrobia bacterium]|nr:T9SS type A sorting domain-containing protein [Candidatus Neomarinimicrobiota bacterium]
MKKITFICFLIFLNIKLFCQIYPYSNTIGIEPENPTNNDEIVIGVCGSTSTNVIVVNSNYTIEGNTIFIEIEVYQGWLTILDYFNSENNISMLPEGIYNIEANVDYYQNDGYGGWIYLGYHNDTMSFVVTNYDISLTVQDSEGTPGVTVGIPVVVDYGFTNVAVIELHVGYDTEVLSYNSMSSDYLSAGDVNDIGGQLNIVWIYSGTPLEIADGDSLLVFEFNVVGNTGDSSSLTFTGGNNIGDPDENPFILNLSDGLFFIPDMTPPETEIVSSPEDTTKYNDVEFEWTGTDNYTTMENLLYSYILDGYDIDWSDWLNITTVNYEDLPNGNYTFKVKSKDEAGNEDLTPAEISFTVNVPTAILSIPDVFGETNTIVDIPIEVVSGFSDVAVIELHISFDLDVLSYNSMSSDYLSEGDVNVVNNQINLVWVYSGIPLDIPDGDDLILFHFNVEGSSGDSCVVEFTGSNNIGDPDENPFILNLTDGLFKVNFSPYLEHPLSDTIAIFEDSPDTLLGNLLHIFEDPNNNDNELEFDAFLLDSSFIRIILNVNDIMLNTVKDSSGSTNLILSAQDPCGSSVYDTIFISVHPVNDSPVVEGIPDISFPEDSIYTLDLDDYAEDVDDDLSELECLVDHIGSWKLLGSEVNGSVSSYLFFMSSGSLSKEYFKEDDKGSLDRETDGDSIRVDIDEITHIVTFTATLNYNIEDVEFVFTVTDTSDSSDTDIMTVTVTPVNDGPVLSALPDTSFYEDTILELPISFWFEYVEDVDDTDETLLWSIEGNDNVFTEISSDTVIFSSLSDWYGMDILTLIVSDFGELSDTTTLAVTVNAVNDAPLPFGLISPADDETINSLIVPFVWQESIDPDPEDVISYAFRLFGPGVDTTIMELFDTSFIFNGSNVLQSDTVYSWYVEATDGVEITTGEETFQFYTPSIVGVDIYNQIPDDFSLKQNYPNPFNPTTTFKYDIPKESKVLLVLYDINGHLIETLVNEKQQPGYYSVQWDAKNVPSGVYFYRIQAEEFQQVKKCLLIK